VTAFVAEAVQVPSLTRPLVERLDRSLFARAIGRVAAGAVMIVGFACVVPLSFLKVSPVAVFGATWLIAGFVYLFARLAVRFGVTERANAHDRIFGTSFAWLGVGVALLSPLSVHAFLIGVLGDERPEEVASWILMSLVIVGAAHAALACMTAQRVLLLAQGEEPRGLGRVYLLTIAWGCVPGVVLFLIPPLMVALTGLAVLPLLAFLDLAVVHERELRLARGGV
jgi:hypothetical protein